MPSGLRRSRNGGTHGQERHAPPLGRVRRDRAVDHAGAIHSAAAPRRLLQSLAARHRIGPPACSALAFFLVQSLHLENEKYILRTQGDCSTKPRPWWAKDK